MTTVHWDATRYSTPEHATYAQAREQEARALLHLREVVAAYLTEDADLAQLHAASEAADTAADDRNNALGAWLAALADARRDTDPQTRLFVDDPLATFEEGAA